MTDTPRTQAELLSIFADNQNHAITAQDMRDYVKSLTDPVPGFPLNGPASDRFSNSLLSVGTFDLPASSAGNYGDQVLVPMTAVADPNGWWDNTFTLAADDPTSAWGVEVTAGDAAMLPPGMYQVTLFGYFGTTPVTPVAPYKAFCFLEFDQMVFDPDYVYIPPRSTSTGFIHDGYYGPFIQDEKHWPHPLTGQHVTVDESVVLVNDTDEAQAYALMGGCIDHTSAVTLSSVNLNIIKVA